MSDKPTYSRLPPQEVLPFPPAPSGSIAGRTMQESVYSPQPVPDRLRAGTPNILIILVDDAGPGLPTPLGGKSIQSCGVHYAATAISSSSFAGRKPG